MKLAFEEIRKNLDIKTYIKKADESLAALGFTEHSFPHVLKVSDTAAYILETLDYSEREIELVKIGLALKLKGFFNPHPTKTPGWYGGRCNF